jgi:U6 snRNA-associated Sm-like protein LSm4
VLRQSGQNSRLLVDCKNGDSYDGTLVACDTFMNVRLSDVVITSAEKQTFTKCGEVFIRGNNIRAIQFQ